MSAFDEKLLWLPCDDIRTEVCKTLVIFDEIGAKGLSPTRVDNFAFT